MVYHYSDGGRMPRRKLLPAERSFRTSIQMPREHHALLARLARQQKRSVSFMVCEAVEQMLSHLGLLDPDESEAAAS
jgi:hypothetical protein